MQVLRQFLVFSAAVAFACVHPAYGQDAPPSLGDVARQSRLQKQQKDIQADKDSQGKDASAKTAATKDATTKDATTSKDARAQDLSPKDTAAQDPQAKTPHVYTNDEIPEHVGPTVPAGQSYPNQYGNYRQTDYPTGTGQAGLADQWKAQFQSMKSAIANLQAQINTVNDSVHYAGGNCVSNCVQWNERQKQKQQQVEMMKQQLEQLQKRLEDMQEAARKQGFGSSVYDP